MDRSLLSIGRGAGVIGVITAGLAGFVRVTGSYKLGGFEVGTLFSAGVAGMVLGCLCLLAVLTSRASTRP